MGWGVLGVRFLFICLGGLDVDDVFGIELIFLFRFCWFLRIGGKVIVVVIFREEF